MGDMAEYYEEAEEIREAKAKGRPRKPEESVTTKMNQKDTALFKTANGQEVEVFQSSTASNALIITIRGTGSFLIQPVLAKMMKVTIQKEGG